MFFSPSRQCFTAPSVTTFHNILAELPPRTLDDAIGRWTAQHTGAHTPLAIDGKDLRGASKQTEGGRRMMVAALAHGTGRVLRQVEGADKSNEIPAVRELADGLDISGRTVTLDAMHAQHETAQATHGTRHHTARRPRRARTPGQPLPDSHARPPEPVHGRLGRPRPCPPAVSPAPRTRKTKWSWRRPRGN